MAPKVLLAKYDVANILESQKTRLRTAYQALSDSEALDNDVIQRLTAQYMPDVPVLKTAEASYEATKTRIDRRRLHDRLFFPGAGPAMVDATELIIHLPFDGDPGIFNITPSGDDSQIAQGEVVEQELLLRLTVVNGKYDIQRHIDRDVQQINWALTQLRERDAYFSRELSAALERAVANRKRAVEFRSSIAGRLNIPQRQEVLPVKLTPPASTQPTQVRKTAPAKEDQEWDVFISHASEDKSYVEPLAKALETAGVSVWYDELVLRWGDDLRPMIDDGLIHCRYGIVVLSKVFLGKKKWTEHELNGLFAREQAGKKLVLPIWHGITRGDLLQYSPALADRLAKISQSDSNDSIVNSLLGMLGRPLAEPSKTLSPASAPAGSMTSPVAHAEYDGPDGHRIHMLVRKSSLSDEVFALETADGQRHEGTLRDIAVKYALADKKLTLDGYRRMGLFGSGKYPEFNL